MQSIIAAQGFERVNLLDDAVEALVVNDEVRKKYLGLATNVAQLYRAILPDTSAGEFTPATTLFVVLTSKIRALAPEPDISGVMAAIEKLLDESIASEGYVIHEPPGTYRVDRRVDLGQIDFEALRAKFERARKHTMAQELRGVVERKLQELVSRNRTRMNYLEQFQRLIEEYNAGSMNIEVFFDRLVALARELNAEEQRAVAEQLTEEELAIFDLLTRPDVQLTVKDKEQVKRAARDLLVTLKREKLVLDWKKRQATRAAVKLAIRKVFDVTLPPIYTQDLYAQKCDQVYEHIYDAYAGAGQSIYAA